MGNNTSSKKRNKKQARLGIRQTKIKIRLNATLMLLLMLAIILIVSAVFFILKTSVTDKTLAYAKNIVNQISFNNKNKFSNAENMYNKYLQTDILTNLKKTNDEKNSVERFQTFEAIKSELAVISYYNKQVYSVGLLNINNDLIGDLPLSIFNDKEKLNALISSARERNGEFFWTTNYDSDAMKMHLFVIKTIYDENNYMIGTMFVDYNTDTISETYAGVSGGKNSKLFTIDNTGALVGDNGTVKLEKDYSSKAFLSKLTSIKENLGDFSYKIGNTDTEIVFSRIEGTELYNIVAFPLLNLTAGVVDMLVVLLILSVICFVICMAIAYILIRTIVTPLKKFAEFIKIAGNGDLSYTSEDKANDEIGIISRNFSDMISKTAALITKIRDMSNNVDKSTTEIDTLTENSNKESEQVAATMIEISKGTEEQVLRVSEGVDVMGKLADGINNMKEGMTTTSDIIEKFNNTIDNSMNTIKELNERSEDTNHFSKEMIKDINILYNDMNEIMKITDMIMNISEQTKLLSLNAAIEAQRAGQAGRGFSVVADEVRKLAVESKDASVKINGIISSVRSKTEQTVEEANDSTVTVNEQIAAVKKTNDAFKEMSSALSGINEKIETMKLAVNKILEMKNKTMTAIEGIAAISEETAACTGNVNENSLSQIEDMTKLQELIDILTNLAKDLNRSIEKFKLD